MNTTTPLPHAVGRTEAARLCGLKPDTLKHMAMQEPPRGPAFVKLGSERQARTLYPVSEIARWQADPTGYRWPSSSKRNRSRTRNERHR